MKGKDFNIILTGLTEEISGLKERRPTAGRLKHLEGYVADVEELAGDLKTDILERVSREIWFEADEGIDYKAQAEQILSLLPIELRKADDDETAACQRLTDALEALGRMLRKIVAALVRHHTHEEYAQLYEKLKKRYLGLSTARDARDMFEEWKENNCFGDPSLEDIYNYQLEKLVHLFESGALKSKAEHIKRVSHYSNEVDFDQLDEDKDKKRMCWKHYAALRCMTDWQDGFLVVLPDRVGQYLYATRKEENAKEICKNLLKYLHKIDMVQQERRRVLAAMAEAAEHQDDTPEELNYFAPTKNLKMLLCEEWFGLLTTDEERFNTKWVHGFVDALMASEWRDQIARDWAVEDKRLTVKCMIVGVLKDAGVVRGSYNSIAKLLDIEGEKPATLAKYMGLGKKQGFAEWIRDYTVGSVLASLR